jgi:hypothetical protein
VGLKQGKKTFAAAKRFTILAGHSAKLKFTLSRKARAVVVARHHKGLKLSLVLAGKTQSVTLIRR